jgi:hypothetical protein
MHTHLQAAAKHDSMVKARELTRLQMAVTAQTSNGQCSNGHHSNGHSSTNGQQSSSDHHSDLNIIQQTCDDTAVDEEPAVSYKSKHLSLSVAATFTPCSVLYALEHTAVVMMLRVSMACVRVGNHCRYFNHVVSFLRRSTFKHIMLKRYNIMVSLWVKTH